MYDIPEDYLLTYDPGCVDLHSNSTDFEDTRIRKVTPKNGNHRLFNKKKVYKKNSKEKEPNKILVYNSQISKNSSKELWESETVYSNDKELEVRQNYQNKRSRILYNGDQIETIKSKRSLIRHKLIPVLSGMFKRSSNNDKMSDIQRRNAENSCQTYHVREPRAEKFNRKQYYAVQPIYAIERDTYDQPSPVRQLKKPRRQCPIRETSRNHYYNTVCSLTSSSEADRPGAPQTLETEKRWKKQLEDVRKGYLENLERQKQKRRRKMPFHVYNNPHQYTNAPIPSSGMSSTSSAVPSTCSGFWDYLFNKINSKYQTVEVYKSCKCCTNVKQSKTKPCCPTSCGTPPSVPATKSCSCNTIPVPISNRTKSPIPPSSPMQPTPVPSIKVHITPKGTPPKAVVECQCPPLDGRKMSSSGSQHALQPAEVAQTCCDKPRCQMTHDSLKKAITQKYNGEILCIHNPPCVVINGCLNLPAPTQDQMMSAWPLLECPKPNYQQAYKKKRSKKKIQPMDLEPDCLKSTEGCCQYQDYEQTKPMKAIEQGCQSQNQHSQLHADKSIEIQREIADQSSQYYPTQMVNQFQLTELMKEEKNIQSFCNHKPPCEVKRICQKPTYDPKLISTCFHVPMCENLPMCMIESNDSVQSRKPCRHKPRCAEVPVCSGNYVVMTAKEEAATQVRPKSKYVCRHEPRCILIPKCVARVCGENHMPSDAIPDCVHQPLCEIIPACCRKSAKEMVSVCSQHPNSCRLV